MNIFSNLELNENSIQRATIDTSKIGTGWAGTSATAAGAGAIRYNSTDNTLEYSTGSGNWVAIGSSETINNNNNVNGSFGIYSSDTWDTSTAAKVRVAVDANGTTTPGENFRCQIQGDGKGTISFAGKVYNSASEARTVSTTIVKILYANVNVTATTSGLDYNFKHSLGTQNLLINTYFSETKEGGGYYNYNLIQCDVEIVDQNNIKVRLRGNIPNGKLKIVLYGGATAEAAGGASSNNIAVQVNTETASNTIGEYSGTGDTSAITPVLKS